MSEKPGESQTPFGTVTFLFTDLVGSSRLWETYPETMHTDLARHDEILRREVEAQEGVVVKTTGDGFHAAFAYPADAIQAAVESQKALLAQTWQTGEPLSVRMGLHTGQATIRDGDYYGPAINRAARVMSVASGGQILLSTVTVELVRDGLPHLVSIRDLGHHRLRSLDRPERLYQLGHRDLPADFPPIEASRETPNNLPTQLTSFIGREREIAQVSEKFSGDVDPAYPGQSAQLNRLVTLTGPGGTGKTRLSLEVAGDLLPKYKDGAWLVEFAPLTDPDQVGLAVAQTFGLRELPGQSIFELVSNYIRQKQCLLILDNCEHLIEACASLTEGLLQRCPQLHILASSREVLGVAGEQVFRVGAMSLPDHGTAKTSEEMVAYDAIRLFVSRAQAVKNSFKLNDANAQAVLDICRRLDGIPLAIELAAARAGVLSPDQILDRLDDRFRLLTGGRRTALPRQRTLQAMIDWSYDLLSEPEGTLLQRLSVFSGGWTLEAAEYVAGIPPIDSFEVLDLMEHLRNKSLIVSEDSDLGMRYQMLETIRQYAQEKLSISGESEIIRDRHLEYYLKLVESGFEALLDLQPGHWIERMAADLGNLRGARERALNNDLGAALRFLANIPPRWFPILPLSEAKQYISRTISLADEDPACSHVEATAENKILLGRALAAAAHISFNSGFEEAEEYATRSIEIASRHNDNVTLLHNLQTYGAIMGASKGQDVTAAKSYNEMQQILPKVETNLFKAMALISMGRYFIAGPDLTVQPSVWEDWETGMSLFRQAGDLWGMALGHSMAAMATFNNQEYQKAKHHAERAFALHEEIDERHMINMSRGVLAHLARKRGDSEKAEDYYQESLDSWQEVGHYGGIARCLECLAYISKDRAKEAEGGSAKKLSTRAATLLGGAAALRQRYQAERQAAETKELEAELAQVKELTGEPHFSIAWKSGQRMDLDQLVALAKGG